MLLFPNAKVNLGLNVLKRREDGFHDLDTVFAPVTSLCDALELVYADSFSIEVMNVQVEGTNLCEKAFRLMEKEFGIPPVHIILYKNIPMGAGLGGGSSDAAFTISGLNQLFSLGLDKACMASLAAELGSDCAFFIYNRPMAASGRGEVLREIDLDLSGYEIRIVPQDVFVSTKEAYAGVRPHIPELLSSQVVKMPVDRWKDILVNDFEEQIFAAHPEIALAKQRLYDEGAVYAAMSGSGSSVFGLFSR